MKKKIIKLVSVLLAVAFSLGLMAGCELVATDNRKDMEQVIAEVNVGSDAEALSAAFETMGASVSGEVSSSIGEILSTDEIYKRDLIAYFITYGYSYVSAGYSYADTFELLLDALADRKMVSQFATLYYLSEGEVVVDRDNIGSSAGYTEVAGTDGLRMNKEVSLSGYLSAISAEDPTEAANAGFEYLLTEEEINYAEYIVRMSINQTIDSYEESIISSQTEDETTDSSSDRTVPTGANSMTETYYPSRTENGQKVIDYDVYTGFNSVTECGEYEPLEGSTVYTRTWAYARFINSLRSNYLIEEDERDVTDVHTLSYYAVERRTQLEQQLISKFSATLSLNMTDAMQEEALEYAYDTELRQQQVTLQSDFVSTMDDVSDTSFILYSPENRTYGFVYNILLPFSADQNLVLDEVSTRYGEGTKEYLAARQSDKELFYSIEATDQRSSWFNGATDYSFNAEEEDYSDYYTAGGSDYLFFRDSYITSGEGIDRYAGMYPYNGKVEEREDGTYRLTANKLRIDDFIDEMESYIGFVVGSDAASGGYYAGNGRWDAASGDAYYNVTPADFLDADNAIDYSASVYYKGSVAGVANVPASDYLTKDSVSYKALSAFNELMFAYTTDTACLNTYFGYSIDSIETATSYVAEFEYAAQDIITNGGAGSYAVVATDYGWHIIYVSFVYTGGTTYDGGFDYSLRTQEGTFSYYYYQAKKGEVVSDYVSDRQSELLTMLETEGAVVKHEDRYADLLALASAQG